MSGEIAIEIFKSFFASLEGMGIELDADQKQQVEEELAEEILNIVNKYADPGAEEVAPKTKAAKTKAVPKKAATKSKAAPAKAPAKKTATKAKAAPAKKKAPAKPAVKEYSKMKVEELKAELESRDLVKTGKKDDLIARLEAHDAGGDDAPKPKSKTSKKAVAKKAQAQAGPVAQENAWGNSEESETGIIFVKLPVGTGGREVPVAVGVQDTEAEEDATGLVSVLPLTEEMIATCDEQKWRYLTDEYMDILTEQEHEMAGELAAVRARGGEADVEEEEE